MPLTEIPDILGQFRNTLTLTYESRNVVKRTPSQTETTCYYFSCLNPQESVFRDSFILTPFFEVDPAVDRQLALIYLSQNLLKNSKTLTGKPLGIMNKTSARLFSKFPTQL